MIMSSALVNSISSMAQVEASSGGGTESTILTTQIQLDGTGLGSLTLANADTYEVLSLEYQVAVADQSQVERYDLATTTAIKVRSQSAINAGANQYVNITYQLASDMS